MQTRKQKTEYMNRYYHTPSGKAAVQRSGLKRNLRKKYGLSLEQYDALALSQEYRCKICQQPETKIVHETVQRLSVDHNHATGHIRGLLCDRCNRGIGQFEDSAVILRLAANYLEQSCKIIK